MPEAPDRRPVELVDGGDRACGDLLLVLAARARTLPANSPIRLVATDPAAAVDLPAWCYLTGHRFVGAGRQPDGRAHYDLQTAATPRSTQPDRPWRLAGAERSTPRKESAP